MCVAKNRTYYSVFGVSWTFAIIKKKEGTPPLISGAALDERSRIPVERTLVTYKEGNNFKLKSVKLERDLEPWHFEAVKTSYLFVTHVNVNEANRPDDQPEPIDFVSFLF